MVLSNIITGYAEKRETAPRVALFDSFEGADTGTAHGEIVESVLLDAGRLTDPDVQRMHCAYTTDFPPERVLTAPAEELAETYKTFVTQAGVRFLEATTANLERVLDELPTVRVVSQSQSQSPGRLVEMFFGPLTEDPDFQARARAAFDVPSDQPLEKLLERLFEVTETTLRQSPETRQAEGAYAQQARKAYERGVLQVVPAGNLGAFATRVEGMGVATSPSAYRSLLVNDYTTVVGSLDQSGAEAGLNSPRAGTEVLAPGIGIAWSDGPLEGAGDGTSLSVPIVAGRAATLFQEHPDWTPFQVENALQGVEARQLRWGERQGEFVCDGEVDGFVLTAAGQQGLITGLSDDAVQQFVEAQGKNFRFGIPTDDGEVFQVVDVRTDAEGHRKLTLDTWFHGDRHILRSQYREGAWSPEHTLEELYTASTPTPEPAAPPPPAPAG